MTSLVGADLVYEDLRQLILTSTLVGTRVYRPPYPEGATPPLVELNNTDSSTSTRRHEFEMVLYQKLGRSTESPSLMQALIDAVDRRQVVTGGRRGFVRVESSQRLSPDGDKYAISRAVVAVHMS